MLRILLFAMLNVLLGESFVDAATLSAAASTSSKTWHYTGTVQQAYFNPQNFPVPIGAKVTIDITYTPPIPDPRDPLNNYFYFSGGDTSLRVNFGGHDNTPVTQFKVVTSTGLASVDQYNFLDYDQERPIPTTFPGYLTNDVQMRLYFRKRYVPGPISTYSFPTEQPDPGAFLDALLLIESDSHSRDHLIIPVALDSIPEPNTLQFIAPILLALLGATNRRTTIETTSAAGS